MVKTKTKGTNKALGITITSIVAVILVGVGLLIFREFKYMPSTSNEILDNMKKNTTNIKDNNKSLTDKILEDLDKKDTTLSNLGSNQEKYFYSTYSKIVSAENEIKKDIKDSTESINKNVDEAEKELTKEINVAKDSINENIDNSRNSINSNINTTRNSINSNINTTRNSINSNINASRNSINSNINTTRNSINSNINASRNSINSNINTTRSSINSNINTTRNSISTLMTRRFDTVDDTLTQLSNDLESNKNTIISAVGTKASELETNLTIVAESIQTNLANVAVNIQTNLANLIERKSVTLTNKVDGIQILIDAINTNKIGTNADTTNNTLFGIAKVALSKVNDIQTDLSTLMTNVSNNLSTLSSDVSSIKVDVSSLSSKIGGYSDATTETTLFGRTNLIFEKVSNVGNMVNTLITEQRTANTNITTKLESILAQNDLAQINDAIVDDLTRAYVNNWQTNSGLTDKQKMEFVITWLRDRNYIK